MEKVKVRMVGISLPESVFNYFKEYEKKEGVRVSTLGRSLFIKFMRKLEEEKKNENK